MAILKHIKSRNANYYDALEYLLFQHDEKTMEPILDDQGRKMLRDEFYMDGLNCEPLSFDRECKETNALYHKNQKREEIKSHHYIISFDPKDTEDPGLTGKMAQELCLELAKKMFPGHQALVVTHTDGGNHSGNIHTHIVINSIRKYPAEQEEYMTQPSDYKAGCKHRATNKFTTYFKKSIMEMCDKEGLHQIDLLSPAPEKVTEKEFRAKERGQKKLEQINQKITASGLTPASAIFQTQKECIREAVAICSKSAKSFEDLQALLLESYNISLTLQRGRYRYQLPDRERRITEKALGTDYGKEHLEQIFRENQKRQISESLHTVNASKTEATHREAFAIFSFRSHLRLVTDLQKNVKAMQNRAYAQKVKITNLQQMADTLIFIQEHGFDSASAVYEALSETQAWLEEAEEQYTSAVSKLKETNSRIHYTGQYFSSKSTYAAFLNTRNKRKFKQEHGTEIQAYLQARDWLKDCYPDGKMLSMAALKKEKTEQKKVVEEQKADVQQQKASVKELKTIIHNMEAIFRQETEITNLTPEHKSAPTKAQQQMKQQKEETL